ncbi:MAG: hypothetical protein IJ215_01425 [Clostridia bacterium]|nr:hypothetical protein [Clostridia bacterium]
MNTFTLNDVRTEELLSKSSALEQNLVLDNIQKMEELKGQIDDYLKKNLDELMTSAKSEKKELLPESEAFGEKVKNEIKEDTKIVGNIVKSAVIEKGAKAALKQVLPFVKAAVKKVVLKI